MKKIMKNGIFHLNKGHQFGKFKKPLPLSSPKELKFLKIFSCVTKKKKLFSFRHFRSPPPHPSQKNLCSKSATGGNIIVSVFWITDWELRETVDSYFFG